MNFPSAPISTWIALFYLSIDIRGQNRQAEEHKASPE
jgi:hypothetical protein